MGGNSRAASHREIFWELAQLAQLAQPDSAPAVGGKSVPIPGHAKSQPPRLNVGSKWTQMPILQGEGPGRHTPQHCAGLSSGKRCGALFSRLSNVASIGPGQFDAVRDDPPEGLEILLRQIAQLLRRIAGP